MGNINAAVAQGAGAHPQRHSREAVRVIEGEAKAGAFLTRLDAGQADPDELALIVAALYGATLRGFCTAVTKALLGARHG